MFHTKGALKLKDQNWFFDKVYMHVAVCRKILKDIS